MAIVKKGNDGKDPMADEEPSGGRKDLARQRDEHERDDHPQAKGAGADAKAVPAAAGGGFFHLYKPGQGYWTRMGTAGGVALVMLLTAAFLAEYVLARWFVDASGKPRNGIIWGINLGVLAVVGLWVFRILNRPRVGDFLIATDSEMKKVNWTSRKELIGSTKVVIIFMLLIALFLFVVDVAFGYFFKLIRVLQLGPFGD